MCVCMNEIMREHTKRVFNKGQFLDRHGINEDKRMNEDEELKKNDGTEKR